MKALVALWDGGGGVPPVMGVARRLVERGHDVTVLADPTLEEEARETGSAWRPWRSAPHRVSRDREGDLFRDWECRTPLGQFNRVRDRLITGPAARFADDVDEELQRRPVDVAVVDGVLMGALVATRAAGVPTAALCPAMYVAPAPGIPPIGLGLRPAGGPWGRARDRALGGVVTAMWDRGLPDVNGPRARRGLPPLRTLWQQWDEADRVLVLTSEDFDLPGRLPANVRYVGPVLDDPSWAPEVTPPDGDEPLVVVSFSTAVYDASRLRRVVAALDGLPVRAVVTTGPAVDPSAVPGTDRIRVVPSAAHGPLVAQAAVVVCHAGHGTLLKELAAGVPTLCMPWGRDQPDNVVRARRHGGVLALGQRASETRIREAVTRLLEDEEVRRHAAALGRLIRQSVDRSPLVAELEGLAARAPAGHPDAGGRRYA